jgi:hypothetical protein
MKNFNNIISKIMYEKYPRTFSLMDLDAVIRVDYAINQKQYQRLIICETKYPLEFLSMQQKRKAQLKTLNLIQDSIDWNKFDKYSGVYILVAEYLEKENSDNLKTVDIYSIKDLKNPKWKSVSLDRLYKFFSNKDI